MPNNITNQLTIKGSDSQVKEVLKFLKGTDSKGKEMIIDFNKIEPMPESLDIPSGSDGENGMEYLLATQQGYKAELMLNKDTKLYKLVAEMDSIKLTNPKRFDFMITQGKQYLKNIADYGCKTWYEWRRVHWGTKWNAYEYRIVEPNVIEFQTAWNGVPGLIEENAKKGNCAPADGRIKRNMRMRKLS